MIFKKQIYFFLIFSDDTEWNINFDRKLIIAIKYFYKPWISKTTITAFCKIILHLIRAIIHVEAII